jgi:gliding motility-associated-like protein
MNERFQTKGYNLIDFEIWIYNRWGELLFTTTDLNTWWDGNYQGNPCQIDVYVWKARYSILSENGDTDNFQKVGRVSLIR